MLLKTKATSLKSSPLPIIVQAILFSWGPKPPLPRTARPEKDASPWAQPSTAGHPTPIVPQRFDEIKNVPKPVVIHRAPEARRLRRTITKPLKSSHPLKIARAIPFSPYPRLFQSRRTSRYEALLSRHLKLLTAAFHRNSHPTVRARDL